MGRALGERLCLPLAVAGLCAVALVLQPLAAAQAAPESPPPDARALHERGVVEFAQGAYVEAIDAFMAADRMQPQPALAYNIARSYEQLHDTPRALKFYRAYLARAPEAPDRAQVEQRVVELTDEPRPQPIQPVELQANPRGATVWVDAEPVGRAPVTLELTRGVHRARFKLAGHRTYYTTFELGSTRTPLRVQAKLESGSDAPAPAPEFAPRPSGTPAADGGGVASAVDQGHPLLRDLGFGAMLASAAALGGAVVFEIMRSDAVRSARAETDQPRFADSVDRMHAAQTLARVFAGAGGGLAALGVTLLVLSRADDAQESHSTRVALHCVPAKCRAELSGVF